MPQNDPGFWETIAVAMAGLATTVSAWAWKYTHSVLGKKAESSTVEALLARFDRSCREQREDNQRIFEQIRSISESFSAHSTHIAEELGKRPTRDEITLFQRRK